MNKIIIGVLVLIVGAVLAGGYVLMDMQGENVDDQSSVDQPDSTDGQNSTSSGSNTTTDEDENVERPDDGESPPPPPES